MALRYELPYFFEDTTGRLSGSNFVEFHERMQIQYIRRECTEFRTVYDIYNDSNRKKDQNGPEVTLYFGPNHTLGNIKYQDQERQRMDQYLSVVDIAEGSKLRRFIGSDGNEYRWGWRKMNGDEWTCTNRNGEVIADYSNKPPMEPDYCTSGYMFTVTEDFGNLATEMFATLIIMRHILEYDL